MHAAFNEKRSRDASVVAKNAQPGTLCAEAMHIFASCYGAEAGVLALQYMPFRGLYLTGGVTAKVMPLLTHDPAFMAAFFDKGRVSPLLQHVPVIVI